MRCDRVKFISTVCEDTIGDMKVLYLPEEYITDQESYYKEYFNKHYDIILGHGITDKIWYAARDKSVDLNHHTTAPIFKVEELCNIANYVYFGHIHEHKSYGPENRFTSVGPSTVWEYGKEWECGYYIVDYDTQSCLMEEEFVVNSLAPKLITKGLVLRENISVDDIDKKLDELLSVLSEVDGLRIVVTMSNGIENFESLRDFIITKVGQHDKTKLVLKIEDSVESDDIEPDEKTSEMELSGKILESAKTPIENQIANFILYKKGENISVEYIKDLLEL